MSLAVFFSVDVQDSLRNQEKRGVSLIPKPAPKSLIDLDDAAVEKKYTEGKGRNPRARCCHPSISRSGGRIKKGGKFRKQLAEVSGRGRRKKGLEGGEVADE